jgi:hypothetical protein
MACGYIYLHDAGTPLSGFFAARKEHVGSAVNKADVGVWGGDGGPGVIQLHTLTGVAGPATNPLADIIPEKPPRDEAPSDLAIIGRYILTPDIFPALEETAKEFSSLPGKTVPVVCHVGRAADLQNLVQETEKQFGPVDILINNSATNIGQGPALNVTDEALLKTIEVNVLSALRLVRLTVPKMIELSEQVIYGDIWERPGLSKRDRSLIVVATLIATYRPEQLKGHLGRALTTASQKTR